MKKLISIIVPFMLFGVPLFADSQPTRQKEPSKPSFPAEMQARATGSENPERQSPPEKSAGSHVQPQGAKTVADQPPKTTEPGSHENEELKKANYSDPKITPAIEVKSSSFATKPENEADKKSKTGAASLPAKKDSLNDSPVRSAASSKETKAVARHKDSAVHGQIVGGTASYIFVKNSDGTIVSIPRKGAGQKELRKHRGGEQKQSKTVASQRKNRHPTTKTAESAKARGRQPKSVAMASNTTKESTPLKIITPPDLFEKIIKRFEDSKREDMAPPKHESFYSIKKEEMAPPKKSSEPDISVDARTLIYSPEKPDSSRNDNDEGSLFN